MLCISINYKKADVSVREKFVFDDDKKMSFIKDMAKNGCGQCVVLCTCSRTEVYFSGEDFSAAARLLSEYGGVSPEELAPCLMFYKGENAVNHLFRVACGIESMALGEDEILGQTKRAFSFSAENNAVSYEFNVIFKAAVTCAKRIKTDTELSRSSVSAATLAANEAAHMGEQVRVLLIGASGEIGSLVLKNLISHKNVEIIYTIRRHNSEEYTLVSAENAHPADYGRRYELIKDSDCIISATTAPHYTITSAEYHRADPSGRRRLMIDLAVPPDIDPAICEDENVRLIGIDYFEQLAHEHNILKLSEAEEAEKIIGRHMDVLKKELLFHEFMPKLDNISRNIAGRSPEEILYKLKSESDSDEFGAVLSALEKFYREG